MLSKERRWQAILRSRVYQWVGPTITELTRTMTAKQVPLLLSRDAHPGFTTSVKHRISGRTIQLRLWL